MAITEAPHEGGLGGKKISRRTLLKIGIGAGITAGAATAGYGVSRILEKGGEEEPKQAIVNPEVLTQTPSTPTPEPTVELSPTPEKEPQTLREWGEKIGMKIGVTVGGYGSVENYAKLVELQSKEFSLGLIGVFWNVIEPQHGQFNYRPALGDLSVAERAGMDTLVHPLIWSTAFALPQWIQNGNFSRDELISIMKGRINGIAVQMGKRIDSVVVVNEAYKEDDLFMKKIGPDYVDIAFETARFAFPPNVKLIYNDFDNHTSRGPRTQNTKQIVDRLKPKGLIDKVGLESTIIDVANPPDQQDVIQTMRGYGLPVVVTEFGVNLKRAPGQYEKQKKIYKDMLGAAIKSGVCREFIVFQIVDKLSVWETDTRYIGGYSPNADPTPFDDNFQRKPAYYGMVEAMQEAIPPKITN